MPWQIVFRMLVVSAGWMLYIQILADSTEQEIFVENKTVLKKCKQEDELGH